MQSFNDTLEDLRKQLREAVPRIVARTMQQFSAVQVHSKDSSIQGDVVTALDFELQSSFGKVLPNLLAGSEFIGEEQFKEITSPLRGLTWIVDPLDGTLNYASGLPVYSVSIALLVDGEPSLALVYDIVSGSVFDALAGLDACLDGVPFRWVGERAARSPVGISSGFLQFSSQSNLFSELSNAVGPRFRILGSQALQLCWAAAGCLRLNINKEAKLWDDAAGYLICKEAGAGYTTVEEQVIFPIQLGSAAARGADLFSIAGDPALVDKIKHLIIR